MQKVTSCFSSVVKKFDLFSATQLLRYKQQTEHKTAVGGIVSIAVIVICVALFYNLGIQTLNTQIIYGLTTKNIEVEPTPLKISFTNGSDFMFCFGIQYVDLFNSSKKYFNITLKQNFFGPLQRTLINSTTVPLVSCTPQHFSYNEQTLSFYSDFSLNRSLCPSMDFQFTVGGRLTSKVYSQFALYIDRCNQTIDPNCASEAELEALQNRIGGFNLYTPMINTIVNPGEAKYKQVYVEEINYYFFTSKSGLWMNAEIQEYQIDTDISLMPYTDIVSEYITVVPNLFLVKPKEVLSTNRFVELKFSKPKASTLFSRSFNKVDSYLSYIGGLISTLLLFFFFLHSYSESSFVVSVASEIYSFEGEDPQQQGRDFGFLDYLQVSFQEILKCMGLKPKESRATTLRRAIDEMQRQLDVASLLKKIRFCEEAVTSILDQHQITALRLTGKKSIKQAVKERKENKQILSLGQKMLKVDMPFELKPNQSFNSLLNSHIQEKDKTESQSESSQNSKSPQFQCQRCQVWQDQMTKIRDCNCRLKVSNRVKQSLTQVINNSIEGNQISRRIISRVSKKIFPENGGTICKGNTELNLMGEAGIEVHKLQRQIQEEFDFQVQK